MPRITRDDDNGPTRSRQWREAAIALRQAVGRARKAKLTIAQHRVLEEVLALTAGYSKLEDVIALRLLTDRLRLSKTTVKAALKRLHDLDIIVWLPGRGRPRKDEQGRPIPNNRVLLPPAGFVARHGEWVEEEKKSNLRADSFLDPSDMEKDQFRPQKRANPQHADQHERATPIETLPIQKSSHSSAARFENRAAPSTPFDDVIQHREEAP